MNIVAIVAWCFMNPNRVSDRKLSPAAIRKRFIAMLTALILATLAAVGVKMYIDQRKAKAESKQVEPNDVNNVEQSDVNAVG